MILVRTNWRIDESFSSVVHLYLYIFAASANSMEEKSAISFG